MEKDILGMTMRTNNQALPLALVSALVLVACGASEPSVEANLTDTPTSPLVVDTLHGALEGVPSEAGDYVSYLGVPFAAPPVGDLRWAAPEAPESWEGVRLADTYADDCMQVVPDPGSWNYRADASYSEDCLYLNVFAPADAVNSDEALPVMFWVFGGGFLAGGISQPEYRDPSAYTDRDVILVTANYRVGSFGYLAHPDFSAKSETGTSGNYGSMDHIAALEWVQDNISGFGGDPSNVTVFGESSGGIASNVLLSSPSAENLWAKSIIQSGPAWGLTPYMRTLEEAEAWGEAFLERRGVTTLEEARALPAEAVNGLTPEENAISAFAFQPITDGVLTPRTSGDTILLGEQPAKPMIIGWTREEAAFFYPFNRSEADMRAWFEAEFGDRADELINAYYLDDEDYRGAMVRAGTAGIAQGSLIEAELHSQKTDQVFVYRFDQVPPGEQAAAMGVPHGTDVGYTFGYFPEGPDWRDEDFTLSSQLIDYWTAFARTGEPVVEGLPEWPAFSADQNDVMFFDTPLRVGALENHDALLRSQKTANFSRDPELRALQD